MEQLNISYTKCTILFLVSPPGAGGAVPGAPHLGPPPGSGGQHHTPAHMAPHHQPTPPHTTPSQAHINSGTVTGGHGTPGHPAPSPVQHHTPGAGGHPAGPGQAGGSHPTHPGGQAGGPHPPSSGTPQPHLIYQHNAAAAAQMTQQGYPPLQPSPHTPTSPQTMYPPTFVAASPYYSSQASSLQQQAQAAQAQQQQAAQVQHQQQQQQQQVAQQAAAAQAAAQQQQPQQPNAAPPISFTYTHTQVREYLLLINLMGSLQYLRSNTVLEVSNR